MTPAEFYKAHPFIKIYSTMSRMGLVIKKWELECPQIDKFTIKYAKEWYNKNQVPR